ncbi:CD209 antigen-like protein D [Sebastes fasciatus]|uniref:CD209 antigen-like protein D n=1 Tax=Sebastes fasciatus TaxID=394691 RepID=UPI003D9E324B
MNRKPREEIEEIEEEADYVNEPVCTVEKVAAPPDQRFRFFTQSFPLIAVCWLILLVIMGLHIYFTSVISENDAKLKAEIQQLKTQNQELETQKNKLTEQIRDMETNRNELNVSRAQWSIDAYTLKNQCSNDVYWLVSDVSGRQCQVCQKDWTYNNPSCYAINNAEPPNRKTWEEAREDCKGKNSDFTVIHTTKEKDVIDGYSWGSSGTNGEWIGLRVEDGKWKWIDGSDLTLSNWEQPPPPTSPTDGHCAISVKKEGWRSVSCDVKQQWICKKNALSL